MARKCVPKSVPTDAAKPRPLTYSLQNFIRWMVGEAIPVSPKRDRSATEDPIMSAVEASLRSMLDELASAKEQAIR